MIHVDDRTGSADLIHLLRPMSVPARIQRLDYGDLAFIGNGPEGCPVPVGIEVKAVPDMLQSMATGRLSGHQLPGLLGAYEQVWLVVEGEYRPSPRDGVLEVHRQKGGRGYWAPAIAGRDRRFMYRELDNYLTTLEIKAGVKFRRTTSRHETARVVADLYHWWCSRDFEDHRSHIQLHQPPDHALIRKPTLLRQVAACLPGVGWKKSQAVEKHFGSTYAMVTADPPAWAEIDGIGKTMANTITCALRKPNA